MNKYDHKEIESKWQKVWEKNKLYKARDFDKREKFYCLDMFPYPSGEGLHVGHWRGYVLSDMYSRYQMLLGKNVLHPMGWDAFGLPAENAAIKNNSHPSIYTKKAIDNIRRQIKQIGTMIDWSREINTSEPSYYRWTQWLFLQMYKNGLAYKKNAPVNWCPSCQTVLANEQVVSSECERCGSKVVKKDLTQWFFRITDFAEDLLKDLDGLDWPERTKTLQRNWIGKSEGALVKFQVLSLVPKGKLEIEVFTTRADTLFGATYLVLAPEHPLVEKLKIKAQNLLEIDDYISQVKNKSDIERESVEKEKTGVELRGIKALNPVNGQQIPIFIADYVLPSYGTGAIMAVPAHDDRDFEFAKKYNLPIKYVIEPKFVASKDSDATLKPELPLVKREAIVGIVKNPKDDKYLCIAWKNFNMHGLVTGGVESNEDPVETAKREILEETGYKNLKYIKTSPLAINTQFYHRVKKENRWAHFRFVFFDLENEERAEIDPGETSLHDVLWKSKDELRDFFTVFEGTYFSELISKGDSAFVDYGILTNSGEFDGFDSTEAQKKITEKLNKSGLGDFKTNYRLRDWLISRQRYWGAPIPIIYCDKCGEVPVPEEDLPVKLPDDVEFKPHGDSPLKQSREFLNTICPKCGGKALRETDTMDTFVDSSWYYLRYPDPRNGERFALDGKLNYWMPVDLYIGGVEHAILHLLYARFIAKALKKMNLVDFNTTGEPFTKLFNIGMIYLHGSKMSKSKGNIVSPDDLIEKYGTDALRGYELFIGPADLDNEWQVSGITGVYRFIEKIWGIYDGKIKEESTADPVIEQFIQKITSEIKEMRPNTAVSCLMELFNYLKTAGLNTEYAKKINVLLAPFFPHLAEELWAKQGNKESVFLSSWPEFDQKLTESIKVKIAVAINGKTREVIEIGKELPENEVINLAKKSAKVLEALKNQQIKKTIYVAGRMLNFVIE